ncbi:hypothetical protein [Hymenobacter cavernae]|uniref:Uncharacterized protein n=1 Tax=Hymenobacter cavernae TaxID=2044852 RepID=A0ABQ1UXH6_9BACT|nr:hypothetical protein [Hymenobacter cavernae]GGF27649.1 hypothetical protein GCM10011383_44170 [Hymenobacter cavernae]
MAIFKSEDLMKATLAKLNDVITGGDEFAPASKNNFVSWITPGMPFGPEDFSFLSKGFNSKDPNEVLDLKRKAADFAMFADFVPDPTAVYAMKEGQTIDRNSQERLSNIYSNILQFAKVTRSEPSAAEKAKLDKFKKLLYTTKEETNLVTDEKTTVTVEGPVRQAYVEKMQSYEDAAFLYNMKRIAAASAESVMAVNDFSVNAPIYRNKVKSAMNAWTSAGYKNEVEDMESYIAQVTGRSMATWFANLRDVFNRTAITDPDMDFTFYPARLYPANFYNNTWPKYSFSEKEYTSHSSKVTNAWNAGGGLNLGLWSAGASASGSSERKNASMNTSTYSMSFDLAQVKILRPWFGTELFSSRGWKLDPGTWTFGPTQLSNGGQPPKGTFIAYSTNAIFARNLEVKFDEAAWKSSSFRSQLNTSASAGWGPFRVKGGYSHGKETHDFSYQETNQGFKCAGMQLIGFLNRLVGVCPNPDPQAKFD